MRYGVETLPERREGERRQITKPADVYRILEPVMAHLSQEQFHVLALDTKKGILDHTVVYQGTVNSVAGIRTAEVVRPAIVANAPGIIVAHNHPSGDPEPSAEDVGVTKELREACKLLDIELLDHIVVGRNGQFVSMKERGVLTGAPPAVKAAAEYSPTYGWREEGRRWLTDLGDCIANEGGLSDAARVAIRHHLHEVGEAMDDDSPHRALRNLRQVAGVVNDTAGEDGLDLWNDGAVWKGIATVALAVTAPRDGSLRPPSFRLERLT